MAQSDFEGLDESVHEHLKISHKSDEVGDFTTSTPRELFKFVTALEKMSYVHLFLEEHNH